jgi:hypothetical protein
MAPVEVLYSHTQWLVGAVIFYVIGVLECGCRGRAYVGRDHCHWTGVAISG